MTFRDIQNLDYDFSVFKPDGTVLFVRDDGTDTGQLVARMPYEGEVSLKDRLTEQYNRIHNIRPLHKPLPPDVAIQYGLEDSNLQI